MLEHADVVEEIGPENILPSAEAALDRAREIYDTRFTDATVGPS